MVECKEVTDSRYIISEELITGLCVYVHLLDMSKVCPHLISSSFHLDRLSLLCVENSLPGTGQIPSASTIMSTMIRSQQTLQLSFREVLPNERSQLPNKQPRRYLTNA
jgi:hypothetical protein